jgi:hypothetical protein
VIAGFLAEKVERVVEMAERFICDPRDVSPSEVTEAKALLTSMHHHEGVLAPIPSCASTGASQRSR